MDRAQKQQRIQLRDPETGLQYVQPLPDVRLAEGKRESTVTILRTGSFQHPAYGQLDITRELLDGMVKNFQADTYGQKIFFDVGHRPNDGAAGEIRRLFVEGNRLRARVEWTPFGLESIQDKGYQYVSADFLEDWLDPESREHQGPVLFGAALVTRPFVKRMEPVQLTDGCDRGRHVIAHPNLVKQLSEEAHTAMNEFLKRLRKQLEAKKLHENVIAKILATAEGHAKQLGEDEAALKAAESTYIELADTLAEKIGGDDKAIQINLGEPAGGQAGTGNGGPGGDAGTAKTLSEDDVKRLLAEQREEEDRQRAEAQKTLASRRKIFTDAIDAAVGLPDDIRKELKEQGGELVTGDMTDDQVKKFADFQVSQGGKVAAARQLSSMGFDHGPGPAGSLAMAGADHTGAQLQDKVHEGLKRSHAFQSGQLQLSEKVAPFVEKVLGMFDQLHGRELYLESKRLADGETNIGHTDLPLGVQRTVIREALHDLRVLDLVNTLTDAQAQATTQIPYELRRTDAVKNDGIVPEGKGIHYAGVEQKMDEARVLAMKIAMIVSNEVAHFSRSSRIDWDAWGRNVASNTRLMRELVVRRICNEMQRASDAHNATDIENETIDAQLDGTNSIIKTAEYPIVRPHQAYDLQGNAIGNPENPITVMFGATEIEAWDGTGEQAAGTYYRVTSHNLGYIEFVDEDGSPVTPTEGTATVSYSHATNVEKFDLDVPSGEKESRHLNGLLRAIGSRKARLSADEFVMADYMLMSPVLNDIATNAEAFAAQGRRDGSDTGGEGDLERIKGLPAWSTNAPGIDLGEERILVGSRGQLTYTIAKPMSMTDPFQAVDDKGRPTGQRQAYGEEYNAIHVPKPIRGRMTSVLAYHAGSR